MRIKNEAFGYMLPRLEKGGPFDELVTEFLSAYGIPWARTAATPLTKRLTNRNIIIRDIMEVLTPEFENFKRYKFIEENNCIFSRYNGGGERLYLSRILTWRTELITKNYCVTPVLTRTGLIVEVLLGLAYQLFDLTDVEPSFVAEFFQNEKYGIALYQHNLYTDDGFSSTWRK